MAAVRRGRRCLHTLLKCMETIRWREKFASNKWLSINYDLGYNKIMNCANVLVVSRVQTYLYTIYVNGRTNSMRRKYGSRVLQKIYR